MLAYSKVVSRTKLSVKRNFLCQVTYFGKIFGCLTRNLAEHSSCTSGRLVQAYEQFEQRSLSSAIWAHKSGNGTLWNGDSTVLQSPKSTIPLTQTGCFYCVLSFSLHHLCHAFPLFFYIVLHSSTLRLPLRSGRQLLFPQASHLAPLV